MNYTLGLDIGITSVGWCILNSDQKRIEDLGVRIFQKAENPNGSSLASDTRMARSRRRMLRRKAHRIERVKNLIISSKILSKKQMETLYDQGFKKDVWQIRAEALDRQLTNEELARVLIHLCKRRGYKSNRKTDNKKESSDLDKRFNEIHQAMQDGGYRTIGEMVASDHPIFAECKRNKDGTHPISRNMLEHEIKTLFQAQKTQSNPYITTDFEENYLELFSSQRPFSSMELLLEKVGNCTFEKTEKRASKASYAFETFNIYNKLYNLSWYSDGERQKLTPEQVEELYHITVNKGKIKCKDIRQHIQIPSQGYFVGASEDTTYASAKYLSEIKKALGSEQYNSLRTDQLDEIGHYLTFCKSDDELYKHMTTAGYDRDFIDKINSLTFNGVCHLSLKVLTKILPYIKQGQTYDKSCLSAGYVQNEKLQKTKKLPQIDMESITNPVVCRSLAQARKVVNAIIDKYGSPYKIHIELAREMSKSYEDREKISKKQSENQKQNEKHFNFLKDEIHLHPKGRDIEKLKLYREQNDICLYSGKPMDINRICDDGYLEVDHILPYSRSFNDSYSNKVLVLGKENQKKSNKIPYEYFGADETRWHQFEARVKSLPQISKQKQAILLKKSFSPEEARTYRECQLNDTRYITSYFAKHIRENLIFSGQGNYKNVICLNGFVTSYIRKRWGLPKDRLASDLHHALDAAVVAAVDDSIIQKVARISKYKESFYDLQNNYNEDGLDIEDLRSEYKYENRIKLPMPWELFDKELLGRLSINPVEELNKLYLPSYTESDKSKLSAVFISRAANRKVTGPAHEATIRSCKEYTNDSGITFVKTPLSKIKLDKNGEFSMYGKETDSALYEAIKKRLLENGNNPDKAFKEKLYKPSKNQETAPIVKSVKIITKTNSIVKINGGKGVANHVEMIRVDVFYKNKKYYLVPIYIADTIKELPNKAIQGGKPKEKWPQIDDSFEFKFSLFKNDLLKVKTEKGIKITYPDKTTSLLQETQAYFGGVDISNGGITLKAHDHSWEARGVGIKKAEVFEKHVIDVLGNISQVKGEKRLGFQKRNNQKSSKVECNE